MSDDDSGGIFAVFLVVIVAFGGIGVASLQPDAVSTENSYSLSTIQNNGVEPVGNIYLWVGHWFNFANPGADTEVTRICAAGDALYSSGITIWVETGNYGGEHLKTTLINYFHAHHVKVVCRIWSDGTNHLIGQLKNSMNPAMPGSAEDGPLGLNGQASGGSIDYQMSIGPEIDAFMIDECDASYITYYNDLADYAHNLGKLLFVNPGGSTWNIDILAASFVDGISFEYLSKRFIDDYPSLLASYPNMFIGACKDYGYKFGAPYAGVQIYPVFADNNVNPPRPACGTGGTTVGDGGVYYYYITLERAIWDTQWFWNHGIFYATSIPDDDSYLPTWWEDYIAFLVNPTSPVYAPTFNPGAGTFGSGQDIAILTVTAGASIYYTTDGSTPTTASTLYTAPVSVGVGSTTIKAIATKTGYLDSLVSTSQYLVYVAQQYTVEILGGSGGSTYPNGTHQILVGQSFSLTAYPNENYTLTRWLLNGAFYSEEETITISGAANQTYILQPEFTADDTVTPDPTTWALTITTNGFGSAPVAGHYLIDVLSLLVSAIALPTYKFKHWLLDGALSLVNPLTITAAFGSSHTLHAMYEANMSADPLNPSTLFQDNRTYLESVNVPTFRELVDEIQRRTI